MRKTRNQEYQNKEFHHSIHIVGEISYPNICYYIIKQIKLGMTLGAKPITVPTHTSTLLLKLEDTSLHKAIL